MTTFTTEDRVAYGMLTFCKNCGEQNPYAVKELTDEEIWELSDMVLNNSDVIGFARAILRKARND